MYYILRKYNKKGSYKIITYIREHVTLFQLMNSLGNVNNDISFVGYWIFVSNYEIALVLNRKLLDMIFALFVREEQAALFEIVFTALG